MNLTRRVTMHVSPLPRIRSIRATRLLVTLQALTIIPGCPDALVLPASEQPPGLDAPLDTSDLDGSMPNAPDSESPAASCGRRGAACCVEPEPQCAPSLRCDLVSDTCLLADVLTVEPQLCQGDDDCSAGETCCPPSGPFRSCIQLEPGGECPLPDLSVFVPADLRILLDEPFFTPGEPYYYNYLNYAPACILEKQCVGSAGSRRLLHFQTHVVNLGEADLVLGAYGVTADVRRAACDDSPYVANYLRYELVDSDGIVVARNDGGMRPPACLPNPYTGTSPISSRFGCGFLGVQVGLVETYTNSDECQWLDIQDVGSGDYRVRITVNPERRWLESSYENNSIEVPIVLPSFDLTEPCPSQYESPLGLTYNTGDYWCDWQLAPAQSQCVPGETVQLGCPDCLGNPVLRVCDGARTCSPSSALAVGSDTYTEEGGGLGPCPSGFCEFVSDCPTVNFTCPDGGSYAWLSGPQNPNSYFSCVASPQ